MANQRLQVYLSFTPDQLIRYYRGEIDDVIAFTAEEISVRFPAAALRRHIGRDGIHGWFEIEFDTERRFVALRRLGD